MGVKSVTVKTFLTIGLAVFIIIIYSCRPVCIINVNDYKKLHDQKKGKISFKTQPLIYALPENVIKIKVSVEKTRTFAGPYAMYAEKYLGIRNVHLKDTINYRISGLNISRFAVPDPDNYYLVEAHERSALRNISLDEHGIINSINCAVNNIPVESNTGLLIKKEMNKTIKTDLTIKSNFAEKKDTTYRTIKTDSSFYRVPVYKNVLTKKNQDEKAEEAAKLILELRESRVSLLTGENDKYPEGNTIATVVNELDILEEKYLKLFTGYSFSETDSFFFEFVPEKGKHMNDTIFHFSERYGISMTDAGGYSPVVIKLTFADKSDLISGPIVQIDSAINKHNGFVYRIPEEAEVKILYNNNMLARVRMVIAQLGITAFLPGRLFNDRSVVIEFYPETGGLMQLSPKKHKPMKGKCN